MKAKKAQVRRVQYAEVYLEVSRDGLYAHLLVDERTMPEATSKEHLFVQMFNLIREKKLSLTRAKRLMREILAISNMHDMDPEAKELRKAHAADRTLKVMFAARDTMTTRQSKGQGPGLLTPLHNQFHGDDFLGVDTAIRN